MPLVGHQDAECDENGHGHDDEGPRDPGRVVYGEELGLGHEVDGHGRGQGEEGNQRDGQGEAERLGPPVEAVYVEDLGDPDQGRDVVEAVVDEQEEPEVHLHPGLPVARHLAAAPAGVPRGCSPIVVDVVVVARQGVLREGDRTPSHGHAGREDDEHSPACPPHVDQPLDRRLLGRDPRVLDLVRKLPEPPPEQG